MSAPNPLANVFAFILNNYETSTKHTFGLDSYVMGIACLLSNCAVNVGTATFPFQ